MTHTGTADVQIRVPTAAWRAALVTLVLGSAALGCGPTLSETVRREALAYYRNDPAYSRDRLRLDCEPGDMSVWPLTTRRSNVVLTVEDVARYSREGSLYLVYCPGAECCDPGGHPNHAGGVAVHCTRDGSCGVVGDSLGRCGETECATF